jgi:hypothetical protein
VTVLPTIIVPSVRMEVKSLMPTRLSLAMPTIPRTTPVPMSNSAINTFEMFKFTVFVRKHPVPVLQLGANAMAMSNQPVR